MKKERKKFRNTKRNFTSKADPAQKSGRPFEKFRNDDSERKKSKFEKKSGSKRNFDTKKIHTGINPQPKQDSTGKDSENKSNYRGFEPKNKIQKKFGPRGEEKKWEKPSVYFKRKREDSNKKKSQEEESSGGLIRLNRYLANAGLCSRREADKMIENGLVSVNGEIITRLGTKINLKDVVKYGGETLRSERNVYILMNKPKDYITTVKDTHDRKTVMEIVKNACKERIYPVGRLDRNTTGVLLLTNDGELTRKLTHPKFGARKIYHVETDKNVTHQDLKKLTEGITLEEDGVVKADEANYAGENLDKNQVGVVLHSGKNRVVRRMFESLGYQVTRLDRVSFAGLTKKDLPRGRWRFLSEKEIGFLKMIK